MKLSEVIDLLRGPRKRGEAARLMGAHPCSLAKWDRQCVVIGGRIYKDTGLQLPPIDPERQAERLAAMREAVQKQSTWFRWELIDFARGSDNPLLAVPDGLSADDFNRYFLGIDMPGDARARPAQWLEVLK